MGRLFLQTIEGKSYACRNCKSHLAPLDDLVSKSFHCRHGKAYLFSRVVNVSVGPREDRLMTTGLHTVSDINCNVCLQVVGWRYEEAFDKTQKYKEGKYILERHGKSLYPLEQASKGKGCPLAKMTDGSDPYEQEAGHGSDDE